VWQQRYEQLISIEILFLSSPLCQTLRVFDIIEEKTKAKDLGQIAQESLKATAMDTGETVPVAPGRVHQTTIEAKLEDRQANGRQLR
jgi:hypothetical protein